MIELNSLLIFSKDAERLGDELSLQRMKSLSESQRALELERKLFSSERLLKQVTRFLFILEILEAYTCSLSHRSSH